MLEIAIIKTPIKTITKKDPNMEHVKGSTKRIEYKHLTKKERIQIETMLNNKHKPKEIAAFIGRSTRTIYREIERGEVVRIRSDLTETMAYSSDRGQLEHDLRAASKGVPTKLELCPDISGFIRKYIRNKKGDFSPDVIAFKMKEDGRLPLTVCTKTIYSYIDKGMIEGVKNDYLLEKTIRRKWGTGRKRRAKTKKHARRDSIEKRPDSVNTRMYFGDWEIDLVAGGTGGSSAALMTLVERKTRMTITRKLPDKSQKSVLRALKSIEGSMRPGKFRAMFKTITADNGSEFLDVESMECSAFSKKQRVKLYYAHAYSSWERGSNENVNRMIRRFIAKGQDIGTFTKTDILYIEKWINDYPRKILNYSTAEQLFTKEMEKIAA